MEQAGQPWISPPTGKLRKEWSTGHTSEQTRNLSLHGLSAILGNRAPPYLPKHLVPLCTLGTWPPAGADGAHPPAESQELRLDTQT